MQMIAVTWFSMGFALALIVCFLTLKAGNSIYLSVLMDHSFYERETAARRQCKLLFLRRRIERFSDQFALRELHRLRKEGAFGFAPLTKEESSRRASSGLQERKS